MTSESPEIARAEAFVSERRDEAALARRIASRYGSRFLRNYARSKLKRDPLYSAVAERLSGVEHPIVDVGCGIGLMAFYLREQGCRGTIIGIDSDARKIAAAREAARGDRGLEFRTGDARDALPRGSVLLLDLMHYLDSAAQRSVAANAASAVPRDGVVILRDGIADGSWRYKATLVAEIFARSVRWLDTERLNFPERRNIREWFPRFRCEELPLHGRTPFNNYLFVFSRSGVGITNE